MIFRDYELAEVLSNVRPGRNGCAVWSASTNHGYGRFWKNKRQVYAHRWLYERLVGKVKAGMELDHLCRNRACVNPAHLEVVTPKVNKLRGFGVGGVNARKTHCVRGHEYTNDNTFVRTDGLSKRRCIACTVEYQRAYRKKLTTQGYWRSERERERARKRRRTSYFKSLKLKGETP